jgi:uncharacterized protein
MTIFVLLIQGFLTGVHYFLAYSIVHFLGLWLLGTSIIFGISTVLSILFFLSTWIASYHDTRFTRRFYYIASVWMGFIHFLSLSVFAIWIIIHGLEYIAVHVPIPLMGFITVIVTLCLSGYGIYHAKDTVINHISVNIKNLPKSWHKRKIALISDVHIGHINRVKYLRNIVKKINAENVELLCIAGDLFDGMDWRLEHLLDALGEITTTHGIVYADGNHETYLGVERAFRALGHTPTRILRDEKITLDGLDIIGIDYPEPGERKDIASTILTLPGYDRDAASILIYHTPYQIDKISKTGIKLELCGHTHKWQLWPYSLLTYIAFWRFHYGLSTLWDYNIYTSSGVGTWWPPMRVGTNSEIVIIELLQK